MIHKSLIYISYLQRGALVGNITELLNKAPVCITEKLVNHLFSLFLFKSYEKQNKIKIIMKIVWILSLYSTK